MLNFQVLINCCQTTFWTHGLTEHHCHFVALSWCGQGGLWWRQAPSVLWVHHAQGGRMCPSHGVGPWGWHHWNECVTAPCHRLDAEAAERSTAEKVQMIVTWHDMTWHTQTQTQIKLKNCPSLSLSIINIFTTLKFKLQKIILINVHWFIFFNTYIILSFYSLCQCRHTAQCVVLQEDTSVVC